MKTSQFYSSIVIDRLVKYHLFSTSSFNFNFRPNDNQTFIVYAKSTLVLYRKGLCGFSWFWDSSWKKSYVEQNVASFTDQRGVGCSHLYEKTKVGVGSSVILCFLILI